MNGKHFYAALLIGTLKTSRQGMAILASSREIASDTTEVSYAVKSQKDLRFSAATSSFVSHFASHYCRRV